MEINLGPGSLFGIKAWLLAFLMVFKYPDDGKAILAIMRE